MYNRATDPYWQLSRTAARNDAPDNPDEGELYLYDSIGADPWGGGGVTAKQFCEDLAALGDVKRVTVRINSPGGGVFDALGMHAALARHPARVTCVVEGLAASAASVVMCAGDEVRATANSLLMIHNASGFTVGDWREHQKTAETLQKIDGQIAGVYAARSGRPAGVFLAMMANERWFTAEEAEEEGLVDQVLSDAAVKGRLNTGVMSQFRRIPARLKNSPAYVAGRLRQLDADNVRERMATIDSHDAQQLTDLRRRVAAHPTSRRW